MTATQRKLAGTLLLVAFVFVYVLMAMLVAIMVLPANGRVVELVYYAIAGLAWVPAAGYIIQWMHRS